MVRRTSSAVEAWFESMLEQKATDGLPLVPPTKDQVELLVSAVALPPDQVLGVVPPANLPATVEAVAVQAALAGCPPHTFGVVVTAVKAMLGSDVGILGRGFRAASVQATASACAPLVIISGPAVGELGLRYRYDVLSGADQIGFSIGRAIRLVLWNLGRGHPGLTDMSVLGHPGKLSFCVAEHPDSPLGAFHHGRGLNAAASAVTVFACDAPHEVAGGPEIAPRQLLHRIARALTQFGSLNMYWRGEALVLLNLSAAQRLANDGWDRADVCAFIYESARRPWTELREAYHTPFLGYFSWPKWISPDGNVPALDSPGAVHLLVTGEGPVPTAAICPGWGGAGGFASTLPYDSSFSATMPQRPHPKGVPPPEGLSLGNVIEVPDLRSKSELKPLAPRKRSANKILFLLNHDLDQSGDGVSQLVEALNASGREASAWISPHPTEAEAADVLRSISAKQDAVVVATAVSGARSMKVVSDAITLETLGIPTASLLDGNYAGYAHSLASLLGIENLPMVEMPVDQRLTEPEVEKTVEGLLRGIERT